MAEEKNWRPLDLLKVSAGYLADRQVPNPRLDAEVLLCEVLRLARRVDLYAGFEREISGKELASYRELIRRRAAREPVSRILGRREFMGISFAVTPDVLSPRPETELLVEAVLETLRPRKMSEPVEETDGDEIAGAAPGSMPDELEKLLDSYAEDVENEGDLEKCAAPDMRPAPPRRNTEPEPRNRRKARETDNAGPPARVLDLGTGSGCIAVAIAAHLRAARVVAVDASPKALAVARRNAAAANVAERVEFRQGDWFAGCREGEAFNVIASNPPYLVEGDGEIWPEVSRHDPPAALYGGKDGLDCYRRIIPEAPERMGPDGWIFLEAGDGQAGRVADMLRRRGFRNVEIIRDYGGVERVIKAAAPE